MLFSPSWPTRGDGREDSLSGGEDEDELVGDYLANTTDQILRFHRLFRAIDEIARSCGQISDDLLGVTGGDIFLQPFQKSEDLHGRRHFAYP
jgi:hypothetical protein